MCPCAKGTIPFMLKLRGSTGLFHTTNAKHESIVQPSRGCPDGLSTSVYTTAAETPWLPYPQPQHRATRHTLNVRVPNRSPQTGHDTLPTGDTREGEGIAPGHEALSKKRKGKQSAAGLGPAIATGRVCQGNNSNHAQTARFNNPDVCVPGYSFHSCSNCEIQQAYVPSTTAHHEFSVPPCRRCVCVCVCVRACVRV